MSMATYSLEAKAYSVQLTVSILLSSRFLPQQRPGLLSAAAVKQWRKSGRRSSGACSDSETRSPQVRLPGSADDNLIQGPQAPRHPFNVLFSHVQTLQFHQ